MFPGSKRASLWCLRVAILRFHFHFSSLPLSVIYGLESPDDMVDALNSLVTECLDRHALWKKVKVT